MNPELTPPSSKTSTPLRPQTSQHALADSPTATKVPHPLRTDSTSGVPLSITGAGAVSGPTGEEEGRSSASGTGTGTAAASPAEEGGEGNGAAAAGEEEEGELEGEEDEDGMDVEPDLEFADEVIGEEGAADEEMEGVEGEGEEEEGGVKGKGKGKAKAGKRKPKAPAAARKRPTVGGKKNKENELYETDTVQRWNTDIGDIIAEQRAARIAPGTAPEPATTSASAAAVPAASV